MIALRCPAVPFSKTAVRLPGLMEARSASVALAASGDSSHLYEFVEHLDEQGAIANLNYWAHWIGERADDQGRRWVRAR